MFRTQLQRIGKITIYLIKFNFYTPNLQDRWFGGPTNRGTQLLQSKRPELHAWSTSLYFEPGVQFLKSMHMQIYQAGVKGIIPWAFTKDVGTYDKTIKPIDIVIGNNHNNPWEVSIEIKGTDNNSFRAFRFNERGNDMNPINPNIIWEKYKDIGTFRVENRCILIELSAKSSVTLFAED